MKNFIKIFSCCLIILFSATSCTSVSEEDLLEPIIIPDLTTYEVDVKPIISANCVTCHNSSPNAFSPFPLETYEEVRDKSENGTLLTRIQLPDGDPFIMPVTGKMPQNLIDIIVAWADDGFVEE